MSDIDIAHHNKFKFNNIIKTILFVVLPGCLLYTYIDYKNYGFSRYVIIDLINFISIFLVFISYKLHFINKSNLMVATVYCLVISLGITLIASVSDPFFNFEYFYITTQMLLVMLIFAIGLFVHFQSIVVIVIFNIVFTFFSVFTSGKDYPLEKFIFYLLVVGGAGVMAYISQKAVLQLYKKITHANILVNVQNEELHAINQSKDELFKIIGHDLKTPFHQLTGLVDLLDDVADKQEKLKIKSYIKEASENGSNLLEDLLKWGENSRLHTNIVIKDQRINNILDKVIEFYKINSNNKQIEIINLIAPSFKVVTNTVMIETVLRNIIANAIKFSHRNSKISIKSSIDNNIKSIIIEDSGTGIKKKELQQLFSDYRTNSKLGTENEKGNGFGLTISKKLMEKQKGSLEVISEYGFGTSVILKFSETQ